MNTLKNYNNQNWEVTLTIVNYQLGTNLTLAIDNVNHISIYNSIESFVPTIEIHYLDYNNELLKHLYGNRYICFSFYKTTNTS